MNSSYIVSSMSGFLHESANQLAVWLSPKLNKISSDWWNDCVLSNLTEQQLYNIKQNNASKLDELDLAALLRITDNNWYLIEKDKYLSSSKMPKTRKMIGVRNTWAHIPARLPQKQQIINDARVIEEFLKQLSFDNCTINDIESFINELSRARKISYEPDNERNRPLEKRKQPSYQTFSKENDKRAMLPKPKGTKGEYKFSILDESTGKKCEVTKSKSIGRGASCLVYSGTFAIHDNISGTRNVIIKEFFPIEFAVKGVRRQGADLIIPKALTSDFDAAMQKFVDGQIKHVQFADENANNALSPMFFSGEANNTYYVISELNKGTVLTEKVRKSYSIVEALELVVSICKDLYAVHKGHSGIPNLYLDCKPNNLFVKEKQVKGKTVYGTHAYLFDFDSVQEYKNISYCSCSAGWSAPEQEFNKDKTGYKDISKIGFHTDIFAIANLMVWLLVGKSAVEIGLDKIQKGYDWKSNITLKDTTEALNDEYFILELDSVLEDMLCFDADERAKVYGNVNAADLAARYVGFILKEAIDATAKKRHEETIRRIDEATEKIEKRIDDRTDEVLLGLVSNNDDIQKVSKNVQGVSESVERINTSVENISEQVGELSHYLKGVSIMDSTAEVITPKSSKEIKYVSHNELIHRSGEVKVIYSDGSTYVGEWKYGNRQGYGRYTTSDQKQVYIGFWDCDVRSGQGRLLDEEVGEYNGSWLNDKMNGHGVFKYKDGRFYNGEWKDGLRSGEGYFEKEGLKTYTGQWDNDKPCGKGELLLLTNGSKYIGNFKNGVPEGEGIFYYSSGNIYEGQWKNGKRHGHGVETYADNDPYNLSCYDGEWENGIRKGRGVMLWKTGEKYEGEWDDVRNGHGIDYYANGDVYDGEWKDDKPHGRGKKTYSKDNEWNMDYYDGYWENGIRKGHGVMLWKDGTKYDGEWDGARNGHGVCYCANGDVYDGEWKNDKRHGKGKYIYFDNEYGVDYYDGYWENGVCKGHGILIWKDGGKYDGEHNDLINGHGIKYYSNGDVYDGEWKNDKRHGKGKYIFFDSEYGVDYYDGYWENDIRKGHGIQMWKDGEKYDGEWDDIRNGQGIEYYTNGDVYDGEWKDDKRHGKGALMIHSNGSKYEGLFTNDLLVGKVRVTSRDGSIEQQFFIDGKKVTKDLLDSKDIDDPLFQFLKMQSDFDSIKKANYGFTTKKKMYRVFRIINKLLKIDEGKVLIRKTDQQIINDLILCKKNYSVEAARSGDISLHSIGTRIDELVKEIIKVHMNFLPLDDSLHKELNVRIGERISRGLTKEQLDQFDACTTIGESLEWLSINRPDHRKIVEEEIEKAYTLNNIKVKSDYLMDDIIPFPIFNSVINHPVFGNEKEFLHIRRHGDQQWLRSITLQKGKQYDVKVFFRNDAMPKFNQSDFNHCGVAFKSTVAIGLPSKIEQKGILSGKISANFVFPKAIDKVSLYADIKDSLQLRYIPGSAKIYNNWKANDRIMSTRLFDYPTGTLLGLNDLNGVIPGGDDYSGCIIFVFEVSN